MIEEYDVGGAPVIFTTGQKMPDNPLHRPEIHYRKFTIAVIGFIVLLTAVGFGGNRLCAGTAHATAKVVGLCLAAVVIYILAIAKKAIIWIVHLYQHRASDQVRLQCVFEPSCSEYMILAVEKYGAIKGLLKGIDRLRRCHPPNGGVDYP